MRLLPTAAPGSVPNGTNDQGDDHTTRQPRERNDEREHRVQSHAVVSPSRPEPRTGVRYIRPGCDLAETFLLQTTCLRRTYTCQS